jgi:LPXTG-motif cell wall-anchored protein
MKIIQLILCLLVVSTTLVQAQQSSLVDDPTALIADFQLAEIDGKIEILKTVDALGVNQTIDQGTAEYLIYTMLAQEPPTSRVQIAQLYLLDHSNTAMKETGVNYIIDGVIGNLDALDEEAAKLQLVDQLENLPDTGQESYAYAGKVSRALVMLEDERGLDVFLTKTPTIRNYSRKDGWSADSPPEKLHKLSLKYQEKFDQSQPNEWDFFWSKFYQLAEARREQGQLLTANDPLINLDAVLDGTFEPKLVAQIETTNETKTLRESAAVKAQPEPAVKKGVQESVLAEPMIKETVRVAPIEITEKTPEESTNWLLWLIGALVVLGGLGLVVRRKN